MQDAFKQAVADAAKTTPDRVSIVKIVEKTTGVRRRRLLSSAESEEFESEFKDGIHLLMEIRNGVGFGLDDDLMRKLFERGLALGDVLWIEPHEVIVTRDANRRA